MRKSPQWKRRLYLKEQRSIEPVCEGGSVEEVCCRERTPCGAAVFGFTTPRQVILRFKFLVSRTKPHGPTNERGNARQLFPPKVGGEIALKFTRYCSILSSQGIRQQNLPNQ